MHASDQLKYGHSFLLEALDGLDESHYTTPGACGIWSVKDIIGHLGLFEGVLIEVLSDVLGIAGPRPYMEAMAQLGPLTMNDTEAEKRKSTSYAAVMAEYETARLKVLDLLAQIPLETQRQAGLLTWYGPEYDLEDFLVYSFYAHKREHGAQISVFKDRMNT